MRGSRPCMHKCHKPLAPWVKEESKVACRPPARFQSSRTNRLNFFRHLPGTSHDFRQSCFVFCFRHHGSAVPAWLGFASDCRGRPAKGTDSYRIPTTHGHDLGCRCRSIQAQQHCQCFLSWVTENRWQKLRCLCRRHAMLPGAAGPVYSGRWPRAPGSKPVQGWRSTG